MLIDKKTYFMSNKKCYCYDVKNFRYKLTEKAPQKAKESSNEYYNLLENPQYIIIDKGTFK